MKKIILVWLLAASLTSHVAAQSGPANQRPEFDHTAVYVRDMQKSADFYDRVLELERIPEPFHDGRHIWYRIGAHDQLHVIAGATSAAEHDVNVHLAFRVAVFSDFVARLDHLGIPYRQSVHGDGKTARVRPDGVHQVYFQDPDGYWIEVNDHK
ncbi:MAG TPA: VOC family protein [Verrucomicrobiae bacterium]|jgi:lactoylglutathione lyase|nr:VOC family protein [Verrucomicrobiae bacterium]